MSRPKVDRLSADWRAVERWLNEKIEQERDLLEQQRDATATQFSRGRIDAFRDVLRLSEPPHQAAASIGSGYA